MSAIARAQPDLHLVLGTLQEQHAGTARALREAAARLRVEATLLEKEAGLLELQEALVRAAKIALPSVKP